MTTTSTRPRQQAAPPRLRQQHAGPAHRPNWLGNLAAWLWLAVVVIPLYWILITSLKAQSGYYASNPLAPPTNPTLDNYLFVLQSDFITYFVNTVVVTVGAVVPAVTVSFMAAYAIVRGWPSRCRPRSSPST
jgi:raffinose/stachyose/melibiose transport system permease protein